MKKRKDVEVCITIEEITCIIETVLQKKIHIQMTSPINLAEHIQKK